MTREQLIAMTFVELADTLVDDFDVVDLLHTLASRSTEVLDASAAGIMLADQRGGLQVMASSTEEARLLELHELQNDEGPGLDCFHAGVPVASDSLQAMRSTWPTFTERLQEYGLGFAQAIPLRLRDQTIGALTIFRTSSGPLTEADLRLGQAMAHVATVGLIQQRAIAARELLAEQLQTALNSRIVIEQAKGVLAERAGLPMDQVFQMMRAYARNRGLLLSEAAARVIDGTLGEVLLRPELSPPAAH